MLRSINGLQVGAALLLALLGAYVVWQGLHYPLGSLRSMGPGYFPLLLGIVLIVMSLLLALEVWHSEREKTFWVPRPLLMISAGFVAFAALLERFGLIPATVAMVLLVSGAERPYRPVATVATAVGLSIIGVLLFIYGFRIPVPAIQW